MTEAADLALLRLQAWMSPAFPVGGFAYSHGLEFATEAGLVAGEDSPLAWVRGLLSFGSARSDAVLLAVCHRALSNDDDPVLMEAAGLAAGLFGAPELALESLSQGEAFLAMAGAVWPDPRIEAKAAALREHTIRPALPVAVAIVTAAHGIDRRPTLLAFLHGFSVAIVSAGVRLGLCGQTGAQRIAAAFEREIPIAADRAEIAGIGDAGSAGLIVAWCVMSHETQHTRLFRS